MGGNVLFDYLLPSKIHSGRIARGGAEIACATSTSREDLPRRWGSRGFAIIEGIDTDLGGVNNAFPSSGGREIVRA